jgi:thiol-disulfide isomerase/thioredoxin
VTYAETACGDYCTLAHEGLSKPPLLSRVARLLFLIFWLFIGATASGATELPANFIIHSHARPVPEVGFIDAEDRPRTLADFKGKVVLLNLWATWCPPCRTEMPALDNLQGALGGPDFEVVALSLDRGGVERVRRYYDDIRLGRIAIFVDRSGKTLRDLGAAGLPTTLLIDREGREVGRLIGPAVWDSPDMIRFLRSRSGLPPAASQQ